jgi:glutamate 5-kinase
MITKLQAADVARRAGADVVIASGQTPDVISRIANGEAIGTRFPALETPLESRKRWIFASPTPAGSLLIDDGAAQALRDQGRSLLPAGITAVIGDFQRGDAITIRGSDETEIARGIARYSSSELERIRGYHSNQISDRLGYVYGPVAVHRNDLILV